MNRLIRRSGPGAWRAAVTSWGTLAAVALLTILFAAEQNTRGQEPSPQPAFRVSVDRIQVSAVVTDPKGRQVMDLGIGDFRLLDGGKPQQIVNCEYIPLAGPRPDAPTVSPMPNHRPAPRVNEVTPLPRLVRRSIVFLLDDESFSATAIPAVRQAVKNAIERDFQPGDLVALIRTSSGTGSLDQFTADKEVLLESAAKIRWRPESRGNPGMLPQLDGHLMNDSLWMGRYLVAESERRTKSVLAFVIKALSELPGRKAIFLISQSLPLWEVYANPNTSAATEVGKMVDEALRAGVVIYCTDPTPLSSLTPGADFDLMRDSVALNGTAGWGSPGAGPGGMADQQAASVLRAYTSNALNMLESYRSGLRMLAEGTGGKMAADTDVGTALGRFANDLQGYYLLTYKPRDPERYFTPNPSGDAPFRRITIRVARGGMHVRSYAGYIASPSQVEPETSAYGALSKALFSPFSAAGVRVTLTPVFSQPQPAMPELTILVHVDARDLRFTRTPDGRYNAAFQLVARVVGEGDEPAQVVSKDVVLRLEEATFAETMRAGVKYRVSMPARKAGLCEARVAVRESATGALGNAREFVEIPNLGNGRLATSGLLVYSAGSRAGDADAPGVAECRRFRREDGLSYACQVFNAKSVSGEARIVSEGRQVQTVAAQTVANGDGTSTLRGLVPLSALAPGYYLLQVQAKAGEPGKVVTASQWTDFEIVP